jgi:hypothetical protein
MAVILSPVVVLTDARITVMLKPVSFPSSLRILVPEFSPSASFDPSLCTMERLEESELLNVAEKRGLLWDRT